MPRAVRFTGWQSKLDWLRTSLGCDLGSAGRYSVTIWADWEKRIRKGHAREEARINKLYEEWKKEQKTQADDPAGFDYGEYLSEDYWQIHDLTRTMYAALVVSLWSKMEAFLTGIVRAILEALDSKGRALKQMRQFCTDALEKEESLVPLEKCVKDMKTAYAESPYRFFDVAKLLKKELEVALGQCKAFETVMAVRVLSNSFKHNDGRYKPDIDKAHTQIIAAFLEKWQILRENDLNRIDYSKLPIEELVAACSAFGNDVIDKVEAELERRTAGTQSA